MPRTLGKGRKTSISARSGVGTERVRLLPRRSRIVIALILTFIGVEAAFSCVVPLSARYFIDYVLLKHNYSALTLLFTLVAAAMAATLTAGFFRDYLFARLRSMAVSGLRHGMFARLQHLSLEFHTALDRHRMLDRFTADLFAVENAFSLAVSWGILPFTANLFCTGLMLFLDWRVGLVAVILWPWTTLAPRVMTPKSAAALDESRHQEESVLGVVEESLSAQAVIRAFAIEHLGAAAFRNRNDALTKSVMRVGLWSAFVERFTGAGILVEQVFVFGLSLWLVFEGRMSPGTMVCLIMLSNVLSGGLLYLVEYLPTLLSGQEAFTAIQESLEETSAVLDAPGAKVLPPFASEIVFSGVTFKSDDGGSVLCDINARIPKGSYVAFVGRSGAGKSAMLNLLMRFRDPDSGLIAVDGHDVSQVTQASLRAQMGVVLQDGFVFHSTIRENIRLGRPAATEDAIADAARQAGLADFIRAQAKGFDTPVGGQDGIRLSGEMTQRLALARAILRKPAILLLDEISSALDPAAEASVNGTLAELAKTATVITLTHRLASVADAARIFVFDNGKAVEQGTHFELMAMEGYYASLWRKQAGFRFSPDGRHVDVDAQRLRSIPILEKLAEPILAELAPFFATETFEAGRDIVRQNDPGDTFYIIAHGKVEVWRTEEQSGKSLCVNVLNDGDFFGEITLITGFPRTATVRTVAVTTCISLGRGQFTKLIDRFPDLKRELSEIGVQRLQDSGRLAGGYL